MLLMIMSTLQDLPFGKCTSDADWLPNLEFTLPHPHDRRRAKIDSATCFLKVHTAKLLRTIHINAINVN